MDTIGLCGPLNIPEVDAEIIGGDECLAVCKTGQRIDFVCVCIHKVVLVGSDDFSA